MLNLLQKLNSGAILDLTFVLYTLIVHRKKEKNKKSCPESDVIPDRVLPDRLVSKDGGKPIMRKKKILTLGLIAAMGAMTVMAGCGNNVSDNGTDAGTSANNEQQAESSAPTGEITVVSREDGSGTRGAFIELLGIEEKNDAGEKVDNTTAAAEITNSTAVMMQTVAGNESAIGYISLGSLDDSVKALTIDGVEPSVETVKDGSYAVSRPFNIVYKEDGLSDIAQDFIKYIMSEQGQAVVEENGYVSQGNEGAYEAAGLKGDLSIGGSSSVTPVMEKLAEAYQELNADVNIEVQETDSTSGVQSASEGVVDIGMASRELKDEETSLGLTPKTIAMDGIAVIVNKANAISELTSGQVKSIYVGETTAWDDLAK